MTLAFWSCSLPRKGLDCNAQLSQLYNVNVSNFLNSFLDFSLFFRLYYFHFLTSTDGFNLIWLDWHSSWLRRRNEKFPISPLHVLVLHWDRPCVVLVNIYIMYRACRLDGWSPHHFQGATEAFTPRAGLLKARRARPGSLIGPSWPGTSPAANQRPLCWGIEDFSSQERNIDQYQTID